MERLLREGLAVDDHPGIVFKRGPSGRRAALAAEFGLHERQIVIALNYAAGHRAEVEARIHANDWALDEAERVAGERERLLA